MKNMFKKAAALTLSLAIIGTVGYSVNSNGNNFSIKSVSAAAVSEDFEYSVNSEGKSVIITKYAGKNLDVVIPETIDGLPVTAIGTRAFADGNTSVKSVAFPASLTEIGFGAFATCSALTEIDLSKTAVTAVGTSAFNSCLSLKKVLLPDTLRYISDYMFAFCENLTDITLPDKTRSVGPAAFWMCTGLTEISIGNEVAVIAKEAFGYCLSLEKVSLPDGLWIIGERAFVQCVSLKDMTLSENVVLIGDLAVGYVLNTETGLLEAARDFVISGYDGTPAESYATDNGFIFISLGSKAALGDVNCDGSVDASDASAVLTAYALSSIGQDSGLTDEQTALADVSGDGSVDASDASLILSYYAYVQTTSDAPPQPPAVFFKQQMS